MEGLLRLLMIGHCGLGFDFPKGLACLSLGGRCHFPLKCLVDHFFTFSPSPRKPGIRTLLAFVLPSRVLVVSKVIRSPILILSGSSSAVFHSLTCRNMSGPPASSAINPNPRSAFHIYNFPAPIYFPFLSPSSTAVVAFLVPTRADITPISGEAGVFRPTVSPSHPQLLCLARYIARGDLLASSGLRRWRFHRGWIGIFQPFARCQFASNSKTCRSGMG